MGTIVCPMDILKEDRPRSTKELSTKVMQRSTSLGYKQWSVVARDMSGLANFPENLAVEAELVDGLHLPHL